MEVRRVKIDSDDGEAVEVLYNKYNAYLAILEYFLDRGSMDEDNKIFDRKWFEASEIYAQLEHMKRIMNNKYRPEGEWAHYRFNFIDNYMEFYND